MGATKTVTSTELQATCLDLLACIEAGEVDRIEVTNRGRVVAVVTPAPPSAATAKALHGALRGRVVLPAGMDLTAPLLEARPCSKLSAARMGPKRKAGA